MSTSGRASRIDVERGGVALAVGDQHLDVVRGSAARMAAIGRGEVRGTAVGQVVAGHARDHRVLEAERDHRVGDPGRLVDFGRQRVAGVDEAEPAGPGAALAQHHERGGAVGPALVDVGAAGLLAHGGERAPA